MDDEEGGVCYRMVGGVTVVDSTEVPTYRYLYEDAKPFRVHGELCFLYVRGSSNRNYVATIDGGYVIVNPQPRKVNGYGSH